MKTLSRIILPLLIAALTVHAGDSERKALFQNANTAYQNEHFDQAIQSYMEWVQSGEVSFELYYNLGNAFYRTGKTGRAIQYWEKAKKLNAQDEDLLHNLELAQLKITDKVVLPKAFFLFDWYWSFRDASGLARLLIWSGWLCAILIFVIVVPRWKLFSEKVRRRLSSISYYPAWIVFLFTLAMVITAADKVRYDRQHKEAVVIVREVEVKGEPRPTGNTLFLLHEGSKIEVLNDSQREWIEISYFDDKVGWVKRSDVGEI